MKILLYRILVLILKDVAASHPGLSPDMTLRELMAVVQQFLAQADPLLPPPENRGGVVTGRSGPAWLQIVLALVVGFFGRGALNARPDPSPAPQPPPVVTPRPGPGPVAPPDVFTMPDAIEPTPVPVPIPPPKPVPTPTPTPSPAQVPDVSMVLTTAVNAERARAGLSPLACDFELTNLAGSWAAVERKTGVVGHGTPEEFRARIAPYGSVWEVAAEARSPEEAVTAWMRSPDHRAILLYPELKKAGGGQSGAFWAMDFTQ